MDPRSKSPAFELSRKADHIDHFLSHDWESSRWFKYVTLLIQFNAQPAAVATFLVSIAVGVLATFGYLPVAPWTPVFGYATYFFVLFSWPHLGSLFTTPVLVFLDKFCISQQNNALKQQGIQGLAAFLGTSKQLTVLWPSGKKGCEKGFWP